MNGSPRVAFLTDIVTPYMVAVLADLARRVELTALFCANTGTRAAEWALTEPLPFRHRVLGGPAIRRDVDTVDLYLSPRVLAALAAERPAVVISGGFSLPTTFAAIYGRFAGARLIIHSDGTSRSEQEFGRLRLLARDLLLREAFACVGNSEPAAQRFIELGADPDRVFRAPHSTNIAPFHAVARRRAAAARSNEPPTVLHVGRLIPRKGVDRLLRAVGAVASDTPLRLVIVGSGPEEARLRELAAALGIERAVEFRGFVDQPGLPAVYAAADIFAMPTLDDPFGIVLLEAAAAGLPLVASPFAGASADLVEDGRSGFLANPDDTAAWSDALRRLARDPDLRMRLGARAHEVTLTRTPEHAANGYVEAVQAVLESPRRGAKRS
jgi:glycosyltransferase involved in cell wall biosynthesis